MPAGDEARKGRKKSPLYTEKGKDPMILKPNFIPKSSVGLSNGFSLLLGGNSAICCADTSALRPWGRTSAEVRRQLLEAEPSQPLCGAASARALCAAHPALKGGSRQLVCSPPEPWSSHDAAISSPTPLTQTHSINATRFPATPGGSTASP